MIQNLKKALVADDEADLREILNEYLLTKKYQVLEASNGKMALEIFSKNPEIHLIISDIRMPEMDGLQLFKELQQRNSKTPFVLITGHADLMDLDTAYRIGLSDFLPKPFSYEEFINMVELIEAQKEQKKVSGSETPDFDYCRVYIEDFIVGTKTPMDIYLKLAENKYLKVAKKENPIESERILNYKQKGLNFLYLKKEDFADYIGLNFQLTKAADQAGLAPETKMRLMKHTLESCVQDSFINGINKDKFTDIKNLMESTLNLVLDNGDLGNLIEMFRKNADEEYTHSIAVAMYSAAVCEEWGWRSSAILHKVAMAGLFHDIGKKELPQDILKKKRISMTSEELKIYESHALRGMQLLLKIPKIPEEVIAAAGQHHENMSGGGFPHRLNRTRIHPIAKIVGTVNEFCNLTLRSGGLHESSF